MSLITYRDNNIVDKVISALGFVALKETRDIRRFHIYFVVESQENNKNKKYRHNLKFISNCKVLQIGI